jgi:o-succinylbenzoate---CoA ligase
MVYTFPEIIINNRAVKVNDILSQVVTPQSLFEESTFRFIHDWLSKTQTFKQFTSGSTGAAKEIVLTRNQLQQSAWRTITALQLAPHQTALVCLDTKYIAGKMMLVRALERNMRIVATEPTANPFKSLEKNCTVDFVALVPMQLQNILKEAENVLRISEIGKIIIGGAAVSEALQREVETLNCEVYATYGMTETVSHVALQRLNGKQESDYFEVLPGITIAQDERGCLMIELPEFSDKIVTNDLVNIVDDRHFQWQGRWDSVINSGGYKIFPEKVERQLELVMRELQIAARFFVSGLPDERLGRKLVLALEYEPLSKTEECELLNRLKLVVHAYEVPKEILYSHAFVITDTGKIDRIKTIQDLH